MHMHHKDGLDGPLRCFSQLIIAINFYYLNLSGNNGQCIPGTQVSFKMYPFEKHWQYGWCYTQTHLRLHRIYSTGMHISLSKLK